MHSETDSCTHVQSLSTCFSFRVEFVDMFSIPVEFVDMFSIPAEFVDMFITQDFDDGLQRYKAKRDERKDEDERNTKDWKNLKKQR